jgi:hypothetical protein
VRFSISISDLGFHPNRARGAVSSALAMWNGYFRRRIHQRFLSEGPGWQPKKEESAAASMRATKIKSLSEHRLKRKLERDLKRARLRLGKGKGTLAAVARRVAVLREFQRQISGGVVEGSVRGSKKTKAIAAFLRGSLASRQLQKSVAGLQQRQQRAEAQASSRILGRSEASIYSKRSRNSLEVGSRIPWFGAQNEGATVAHGAKLPARPAIYVEPIDVEVLLEIVLNKVGVFG